MSIVKNRNKRLKSKFLKTYLKLYKETVQIRKEIWYLTPPRNFTKRMIRLHTKRCMKGNNK